MYGRLSFNSSFNFSFARPKEKLQKKRPPRTKPIFYPLSHMPPLRAAALSPKMCRAVRGHPPRDSLYFEASHPIVISFRCSAHQAVGDYYITSYKLLPINHTIFQFSFDKCLADYVSIQVLTFDAPVVFIFSGVYRLLPQFFCSAKRNLHTKV